MQLIKKVDCLEDSKAVLKVNAGTPLMLNSKPSTVFAAWTELQGGYVLHGISTPWCESPESD